MSIFYLHTDYASSQILQVLLLVERYLYRSDALPDNPINIVRALETVTEMVTEQHDNATVDDIATLANQMKTTVVICVCVGRSDLIVHS